MSDTSRQGKRPAEDQQPPPEHHHCRHHRRRGPVEAEPTRAPAPHGERFRDDLARWGQWCWSLLLRNRLAIAVASLAWLIYRSGTQPRRIGYPCQQAAAANVGVIAAGLIPAMFVSRRHPGRHARPRAVVLGRQFVAASILFVAVWLGIEGYQFAQSPALPSLPEVPPRAGAPTPTTVGIAQRDLVRLDPAFTTAEIETLVRRAIERAGGLAGVVHPGDTVVLKPNLVQPEWQPSSGVVTDPRVCLAVAKVAKEAGAGQVIIAEGTAATFSGGPREVTWMAYKNAGYDANEDRRFDLDPSITLVDLNDAGGLDQHDPAKVTLVTVPNGVIRTQYYVPKILLNPNTVLISIPTFKNHYNGTVTLAMKNRVGTAPNDIYHMPGWNTMKWALMHSKDTGFPVTVPPQPSGSGQEIEHQIVHRTLVDLNLARPNDFAVVDGLIGVMNGPNSQPVQNPSPRMQMIVAGEDSVAVDTVCSLAMNYRPEYIPQIVWADGTGALGTKDRSVITVQGHRVWRVRRDFPEDYGAPYGGAIRCELIPPILDGISVNEGDTIVGGQVVTAWGLHDNVGVVRAELAVSILGPNLLQNGDFETGYVGQAWDRWRADWGTNESWDFLNTEPGHLGSRCLKLGAATTVSSFGAYQQVAVEPGKTYRLDAFWKGQKLGNANWFEVLLLDGPFDSQKADSGSPASQWVEPNYIYAYDNNTFGLAGPIGTTFGWGWGHSQYGPPRDQVDWNNRQGRRTATGSTMTVVLKAGACCGSTGVAAWFDNVLLREVAEDQVLASVPNPPDPVELIVDASRLPVGSHDAELRVTVYDASLNEDSQVRNVVISAVPPGPWVCVTSGLFEHTVSVGNCPGEDTIGVWNCGIGTLTYTITDDADWLEVVPVDGVSTGLPANLHAITYHCDQLPPGTYVGTITIAGSSNQVDVTVRLEVETVLADFDRDGDVDLDDFGAIQTCLSPQPGGPPRPGCEFAMLDADPDVDATDVGLFLNCMSGAHVRPDQTCDDAYR